MKRQYSVTSAGCKHGPQKPQGLLGTGRRRGGGGGGGAYGCGGRGRWLLVAVEVLLYVHRNRRLIRAQDGHLDFHTAPEPRVL